MLHANTAIALCKYLYGGLGNEKYEQKPNEGVTFLTLQQQSQHVPPGSAVQSPEPHGLMQGNDCMSLPAYCADNSRLPEDVISACSFRTVHAASNPFMF
jgi:hypothetical protein